MIYKYKITVRIGKKLRDGNYILKYFYKCNYKRSFIQSIKNIKLIDKIPKIIVI